VERHTYLQLYDLLHRIRLPKLCYSYVEWTVPGIEPRTFRLQGEHSTEQILYHNLPLMLLIIAFPPCLIQSGPERITVQTIILLLSAVFSMNHPVYRA